MEGLMTPDGKPIPVTPARSEAEFAAALAKPAADIPSPPDAPSKEQRETRRAARAPRASKAAQGPKESVKAAPEAIKTPSQYQADAEGLVTSVWMVTAALPP